MRITVLAFVALSAACGSAPPSALAPAATRWNTPLELHVAAGDEMMEALLGAAEAWTALGIAPGIQVVADLDARFEGRAPMGGVSTVTWRDNIGVLAGTFVFPDADGEYLGEVHIVLGTHVCWGDGLPTGQGHSTGCYDRQSVLTHELGHALGIQQHLETGDDAPTMQPGTRAFTQTQRSLEGRDVEALEELYALPADG
jgi:hypothetical protein